MPRKPIKKWYQMTHAEKRVAIAKDVLEQIAVKKFKPVAGSYIDDIEFLTEDRPVGDIKSQFNNIKSCEVCALGATLMSCTKFANHLSFHDIGYNLSSINKDKANKILTLFKGNQLLLIEEAFEKHYSWADRYGADVLGQKLSEKEQKACQKFYKRFRSDTNRLKAIMNNIIDNKGTFIP